MLKFQGGYNSDCILGNFSRFFCRLLIFFKINFFKKSFQNAIGMSNSLDPDLSPNCLPRLSADDTGRQRVKEEYSYKTEMYIIPKPEAILTVIKHKLMSCVTK